MALLWVSALAFMVSLTAVNCACPTGWIVYGGNCYYGSDITLVWDDARKICKEIQPQSDLASVHSLQENAFLNEKYPGEHWFGLNDRAKEGTFVWSNGERVDFTNWDINQPDNAFGTEDCGKLRASGRFNDSNCTQEILFICQMHFQ